MGGDGGDSGGDGGDVGGDGGEGGGNMQMHWKDEEHEPELPPPLTKRSEDQVSTQPGGRDELVLHVMSLEVLSGRSSAVAAASHSLVVEMRPPPQEPLSIM